jgi:hypothetical protein
MPRTECIGFGLDGTPLSTYVFHFLLPYRRWSRVTNFARIARIVKHYLELGCEGKLDWESRCELKVACEGLEEEIRRIVREEIAKSAPSPQVEVEE